MKRDIYNDVKGQTEEELQQKCVFWFHNAFPTYRGCLFHVPNGGLRNRREAHKLRQLGVYPGVADLLLLVNGQVWCLEMKKEGGKQSTIQKEWESKMIREEIPYFVCDLLSTFKRYVSDIMWSQKMIRPNEPKLKQL